MGANITQLLKDCYPGLSRQEIIEIAYDLQAGSYIEYALKFPGVLESYSREIYDLINPYLAEQDVILDCGAGELTTLSALSEHLPAKCQVLACDISLSRLIHGRRFADRAMRGDLQKALRLFVADMSSLPLPDNSVDVVFTSHALEPNHGSERVLLGELLRVARRQLLLFEPSWENGDELIRARMQQHGYVRDLPQHIEAAGGRLLSVKALPSPLEKLNPTYCYVVEPINKQYEPPFAEQVFQCPRSGYPLHKQQNYWWSNKGGWAFPEINGIVCLRHNNALLMSNA